MVWFKDRSKMAGGHRIYYFSEKLQVSFMFYPIFLPVSSVLLPFFFPFIKLLHFMFYYYFFSLQIDPKIISRSFSNHVFLLQKDFEATAKTLDILQYYKIEPLNILRDPNVFAHSTEKIVQRLERVKQAGIEKLMPWMVKCLENKLTLYVHNSWRNIYFFSIAHDFHY